MANTLQSPPSYKQIQNPLRVYMSSFKKLNENKTNPEEEGNTYLLIAPEGSEERL